MGRWEHQLAMTTQTPQSAPLSLVLAVLKDLDSVAFTYKGKPIEVIHESASLDDCSVFYVGSTDAYGHPDCLVHVTAYRGDGFEDAYEAWVDSMPTIDAADLPEAYCDPRDPDNRTFDEIARDRMPPLAHGVYGSDRASWDAWHAELKALAMRLLREAGDAAHENGDDYPEVTEGYREDSSGNVKDIGNESFYEADLADIEIFEKEKIAVKQTA